MCGIYGIVSRKGDIRSESNLLLAKKLANSLEHRGPDEQQMTLCGNHALLGHTRLAINDVSGGKQPFKHSALQGITSVVNGEIYNYHDIRSRYFSSSQFALDTRSDCEPVAYFLSDVFATTDVTPLGMFAAASYSIHKKRLLLTRDFFGEKPLYYFLSDHLFVFSSELRSLVAALKLSKIQLNLSAVVQYLLYGYSIGDQTIYHNIRQVPSGSIIELSTEDWNLSSRVSDWASTSPAQQSVKNDYDSIKDAIETYVKDTTLSDQPICLGLSGGLDSTFIAALTKDKIQRSYTINYEAQGGSDEAADAKRTANFLDIPHDVITIRNDQVANLFVDQVKRKDVPIVDVAGIAYSALYERMHSDGFKVALMGHGGDELFMGYPWLFKSFKHNLQRSSQGAFIYEELPDFRTYFHLLSKVLKPEHVNSFRWLAYRPEISELNNAYAVTFDLVRRYWMEPNSLKMGDSLSMSHSIESRHPLLSKHVYQMLQSADSITFLSQPKALLKRVMRDSLPDHLIQREKRYFAVPYMEYYAIIDQACRPHWQKNQVLRNLDLFNDSVMNRFYLEGFQGDAFDYYLFPKLSTLQVWLQ
jgi:asparagine synthase (glutamine-hydrolysing)